jgi:hypothetical protein
LLNSTTLYHPAPANVINIPNPFKALTLTPKIRIPSRTVRLCFTFPHTVIVNAPAFLFVENELIFSTNAKTPLPAKARARFRDGRGRIIDAVSSWVLRDAMKADSSPERYE